MPDGFAEELDVDLNYFFNLISESQHDNENYYNSHKFNTNLAPNIANNDLSIFHMNLRSLNTGGDHFIAYLEILKFKFDITCFEID